MPCRPRRATGGDKSQSGETGEHHGPGRNLRDAGRNRTVNGQIIQCDVSAYAIETGADAARRADRDRTEVRPIEGFKRRSKGRDLEGRRVHQNICCIVTLHRDIKGAL